MCRISLSANSSCFQAINDVTILSNMDDKVMKVIISVVTMVTVSIIGHSVSSQ